MPAGRRDSTRAHRIGFAIAGDPTDPAAYSGAPASLLRALDRCGADVTTLNADLPAPWQQVLVNALALGFLEPAKLLRQTGAGGGLRLAVRAHKPKLLPSREMTAIRSTVAAWKLRRADPLVRVVQFGSEYRLPPGTDYVTLDDATIAQLYRAYPYEWMQAVSDTAMRRMIARQARVFRGARACCVLNEWAAASVVEDYGLGADRVHIVGTGSNRDLQVADRCWDVPRFLFVGKDFQRKNGPRVLEAFAQVRRLHPQATLDVVGSHPPIKIAGVTPHGPLGLDVPVQTARLNGLFARATCLVVPSLLEPTGNVHAEALAAGIGSIGTRAGGARTVVGDTGLLVSPEDTGELVAAMLRFCHSQQMREYGRRAQGRAALFTWTAVAERVIRALALPGVDDRELADFL